MRNLRKPKKFPEIFLFDLVMSKKPPQMYCEGINRSFPLILWKGEKQLWEQIWFWQQQATLMRLQA